jgi:hypothetical protein
MLYYATSHSILIIPLPKKPVSIEASTETQHSGTPSVQQTFISSAPSTFSWPLKTYQLLQIPTADLHIPLVLIQAFCKLLCIYLTASLSPSTVLLVASGRNTIILLLLRSWLGGSTTKEATNCVADGRANCYTTVSSSLVRV